jgi:hypothetical protein
MVGVSAAVCSHELCLGAANFMYTGERYATHHCLIVSMLKEYRIDSLAMDIACLIRPFIQRLGKNEFWRSVHQNVGMGKLLDNMTVNAMHSHTHGGVCQVRRLFHMFFLGRYSKISRRLRLLFCSSRTVKATAGGRAVRTGRWWRGSTLSSDGLPTQNR